MYRIDESQIQGLGITANRDIPKGVKIGVWISKTYNTGRFLNNDWFETKDLGRYCNHKLNPNTYYIIEKDDVVLYSKGINKDEEILVNYLEAEKITGYKVNNEEILNHTTSISI